MENINMTELQDMDMTELAKLLYRDNIRQKHSEKPKVTERIQTNDDAGSRSIKPLPVTACPQVQLVGNHMIQAGSQFSVFHLLKGS